MNSREFTVGSSYQVADAIGEGAYGVVVSAVHVPTQRKVAIKRITPFDHSMFCLRTLREIKLLRHFHHENIIAILDILRPPSIEQFNEVYLVQELMETDLHRVIRTQELSDDHCQYFIYQTLRALKALHSADVLHRDLKPSNLLLNANCDLKLCDFGLARSARPPPNVANDSSTFMTEYVATRRVSLSLPCSFSILAHRPQMVPCPGGHADVQRVHPCHRYVVCRMCARGDVVGETTLPWSRLYVPLPLFIVTFCVPHTIVADHDQLSIILDVLGTPSIDDFYAISSQRSREYIRALPFRKKRPLSTLFPKANPDAIDLMEKLLTFSPKRRIEVEDALAHPYLSPYHDPADEPTADPIPPSFFDFDNGDQVSKEDLKVLIYDEITRPDNPSAPFELQSEAV
ncbi:unnamed protein product [Mycena citricolor]|uniref:Mitogen-activated protein kinase n=1 Tax=Mycena citricolor TaxID=2018698 RepID=A0AAD2HDP4_9AGAR|nr:unnamed protein product [Mycena citricolor]